MTGGPAFLDWPHPVPFAHRGGAGDWPENTMPAFEGAVALGYRYLETDVHRTSDGVLVAFHDEALDRVTDGAGLVREQPWSVVSKALVAGREPIPRLEDLLGAFPEARFNLDVKHDSAVDDVVDAVRRTGVGPRTNLAAFSDRRLARLRQALGPAQSTALGPREVARLRAASLGAPAGRYAGTCAQVPPRMRGVPLVDRRFVTVAHRLGIAVHVWTIDDPAEMHRLLDLGVDGIMTDRPAVLREVLESRGQWS